MPFDSPSRHSGHCRAPRRRGADLRRHAAEDGAARAADRHSRSHARRNGHARHRRRSRARSGRRGKNSRRGWRRALDIPDGRVENTWENRLKVASVIRETRPRVVILPYWKGRHPDHYTRSVLGYEACFLAGLAKLRSALSHQLSAKAIPGCQRLRTARAASSIQDYLRHALLRCASDVCGRHQRAVRAEVRFHPRLQVAVQRSGGRQRHLPCPR